LADYQSELEKYWPAYSNLLDEEVPVRHHDENATHTARFVGFRCPWPRYGCRLCVGHGLAKDNYCRFGCRGFGSQFETLGMCGLMEGMYLMFAGTCVCDATTDDNKI